jgi:hypothetical protein
MGSPSAGLPYLDQLSLFGGTSGYLALQQQHLLQQQQQMLQQQQLLAGLDLPSAAGPGAAALMLGSSAFNRERFLREAASAESLPQSYIQDLSPQDNTAPRFHSANFRNLNTGSNNQRHM